MAVTGSAVWLTSLTEIAAIVYPAGRKLEITHLKLGQVQRPFHMHVQQIGVARGAVRSNC